MIDAFVVAAPDVRQMLDDEFTLLSRLSKTALAFVESAPKGQGASVILPGGTELIVPLEGLVDVKKECARLKGELANLVKQLTALEARLEGLLSRGVAAHLDLPLDGSLFASHLGRCGAAIAATSPDRSGIR